MFSTDGAGAGDFLAGGGPAEPVAKGTDGKVVLLGGNLDDDSADGFLLSEDGLAEELLDGRGGQLLDDAGGDTETDD